MTCDRYIFWHQLLVCLCDSCILSLFMLIISYTTVLLFILLFSLLYLQLFLLLFMHIVYLHELFPLYTHTHHGRVLTTLDLHVQILDDCFCCADVRCAHIYARSLSPSLFLVSSFLLYFCYIHDFSFTAFSCHFLVIIHLLSLWLSWICIIAVIDDYYSSDL